VALSAVDHMPIDLAAEQRSLDAHIGDYNRLAAYSKQMRNLYLLYITVIAMFVLFFATWIARILADQISNPISALLRAAGGRELRLMFPMVSEVAEFDKAKSLVEMELTHLRRHGHALPERVQIGAMLEVPSLLFQLDELLDRVDFLSVGSNDLLQFLYAVDRGNARVCDRFDPLSAPMLRVLKDIAAHAKQHGKPVALCGELGSQPIGALALAILGYRTLSLSPSAVGPVKALLLDLDCRKGEEAILPLLKQPIGSVPMRQKLEEFAAAEGLQL